MRMPFLLKGHSSPLYPLEDRHNVRVPIYVDGKLHRYDHRKVRVYFAEDERGIPNKWFARVGVTGQMLPLQILPFDGFLAPAIHLKVPVGEQVEIDTSLTPC